MAETSRVFKEALALSPQERARLAASLIDSLDPGEDEAVDQAWRKEIARRVRELDAGEVEAIDWIEARRQILG